MKKLGLIGFPLDHSFSKKYFTEKFSKENIKDFQYDLYPLADLSSFQNLLQDNKELVGLNITIPFKEKIIAYLDEIDSEAAQIGAVNTLVKIGSKWKGFNTDIVGFQASLDILTQGQKINSAMIFGTGGASKSAIYILNKCDIPYKILSRFGKNSYKNISTNKFQETNLFINCTPIGTFPKVEEYLPLPYEFAHKNQFFLDMVYNPPVTRMMELFEKMGTKVLNGKTMLESQALASWNIWNNHRQDFE